MLFFDRWDPPPLGSWRNVAIHEAGHAVLMRHYGIDPGRAEISADGDAGYVSLESEPISVGQLSQHGDGTRMTAYISIKHGSLPKDSALQSAVIYLGGYQAELIAAGLTPSGLFVTSCTDTRRAKSALWDELRSELPMYWCQAQARYLLQLKWAEVLHIAASLEQNRVVQF
jgi:hypothetical protein